MAGKRFTGITIDAQHSRDLDDAIFIEKTSDGWFVEICVPFVSGAVPRNSSADHAARELGFTRYNAYSARRSMLDPVLSEQELTLAPGKPRDVIVMRITLDAAFAVTSFEFDRGVFESMARLSHEEAGHLISHGSGQVHEMLARAWVVAVGLLELRRRSGSLTWFSERSGVIIDEDGRPVILENHHAVSRAYLIVQEFMILANSAAAEWCVRNEVPIIFRNQRGNSAADRAALAHDLELISEADPQAEAAGRRLSMMLNRAFLSRTAVGHFALGLPVYAWFSSPLRRYADLVNQRAVIAHLDGQSVPEYDAGELEVLSEHLNALVTAQKEETSSFMVSVSEARARRHKEQGRLSSISATEMTAVIKAAKHAHEFDDALVSEIEKRLSVGGLTDKDKGRLLLSRSDGANAAQTVLFGHLEGAPHEAISIINYLVSDQEIEQPSFSESTVGDKFVSEASLSTKNGTLSAKGQATSKKAASQRAAVGILAALAGFAWTPPEEWNDGNGNKPKAISSAAPAANAKGDLISHCQIRKLPAPTFDMTRDGPPHDPLFTAVASVGVGPARISSSPMVASSKKEAEQKAAADLLATLKGNAKAEPKPLGAKATTPQSNAKNALQELCQKRKWSLPTYETTQSGSPPVFTATASVKTTGGKLITSEQFEGSTKKAAEMLAAEGLIGMI
ncbi:RNB domain-containing ribonuclease [Rhizobium sp. BK176]|uniref:RNB domain-containing ribonuclease n=1 Tax=Rhizobium sp. BK176 TaxID=2587071 RepID=UPI00216834A0|nr:RNB domain-containing ribonuclease [Rhizobium sp. BK176]MCS4090171.1 ribonuclease R [Rhizobium sp. BK176]